MSLQTLSAPKHTFVFSPSPSSSSSKGSPFVANKDKRIQFNVQPRRRGSLSLSKLRTHELSPGLQHELPVIQWQDVEGREHLQVELRSNAIKKGVEAVKRVMKSIRDGEITVSAYDTAWVALIEEDDNGGGDGDGKSPQFPTAIGWIASNQLPDGSWGDSSLFSYHDRLINTLACVIALRHWKMFPHQCNKGIEFFRENIEKLREEKDEHMPIGFEVAFPSLLDIARRLDIDVPYDSPVLQEIHSKKNLKLTRIPKEIMHKVPTTLLHSLEGMPGLDWERLLKFQCQDGSFLFSPSSTAFAFMETRDDNCLRYLRNVVQRFDGGVPNVYPVDLFERMWVVDRLQRLGISRYFEDEIDHCMDYVHRHWTEDGICWASHSPVQDIDDTAMAFRLLRMHGYDVSADVFKNFEKDEEFFCFVGQSNQAVTGMFNLYRASQLGFAGEEILQNAKEFSYKFLRQKQESDQLVDKWIITKDLPGEVGFALETPWYAALPRVETRFYIDQYGGEDDVWIGKTLYRMPYVNNDVYLEVAKQDYNSCQAIHQIEWDRMQKWYEENGLSDYGVNRSLVLVYYFLAAASIFEPERSYERIAWAKSRVLVEAISSCCGGTSVQKRGFLDEFESYIANAQNGRKRSLDEAEGSSEKARKLVGTLAATLNHMSLEVLMAHGLDVTHHLYHSWREWVKKWEGGGGGGGGEAELMVKMISVMRSGGRRSPYTSPDQVLSHPLFHRLSELTNRLCLHLVREDDKNTKKKRTTNEERRRESEMMKELVEMVLKRPSSSSPSPSPSSSSSSGGGDDLSHDVKLTFLIVAKSYYYLASCDAFSLHSHIAKVLFQRVN
ncbi:PREDICTED: ent-copalyl diphosphate synthase, chloroplastic [Tarenaya hassleriana]|uniref:ent-copalyl diphosphate synthase, chloroplastic n=1 Tax=Tarenaya hassleriana TaxID=28532 RepID=UPI00053C2B67|nr:PREDICTED: ent-copalyl diphosphate synthase, chloroplastic [Tarenaya hassleriana]